MEDVETVEDPERQRVCPDCHRCFASAREACPTCGRDRPNGGWSHPRETGLVFLGRMLDDRYALDRYLGGGSAGAVYRAFDTKLGRPFALKILGSVDAVDDEAAEEGLRRFDNEVDALARIRNPHVVNIYESFRLDGDRPAMLTEFVEGETYRTVLNREDLDLSDRLELVRQVANGLYEAHSRGIVHRDVKPANIMVERLPAAGLFARILDFGVAHLVEEADATQGFWGTPLYAAPEQGAVERDVSPATDVYALGCVLFRALTGRPPYPGENGAEVMEKHLESPVPRPSDATDHLLPSSLDDLVAGMLAKDPSDRPRDMAAVVEDLDPILRDGSRSDADATRVGGAAIAGEESGFDGREADGPRAAQLLRAVDLASEVDEVGAEVSLTGLDPSGDCAVVADPEGRVVAVNTRGGDYGQAFEAADVDPRSLAVDTGFGRVVLGGASGDIVSWRFGAPEEPPTSLLEVAGVPTGLELSRRERTMYVGTDDGLLFGCDPRVGRSSILCDVEGAIVDVRVISGQHWILMTTETGRVLASRPNPASGDVLQVDRLNESPVALDMDEETGVAAVADAAGRVYLFDMGESLGRVTVDTDISNIRSLAIASDGQVVALSVEGAALRAWRLRRESFRPLGPSIRSLAGPARDGGEGNRPRPES